MTNGFENALFVRKLYLLKLLHVEERLGFVLKLLIKT